MKSTTKIISLLFLPLLSVAQEKNIDSLKTAYGDASSDSVRFATGRALYYYYEELNRDTALYYAEENLQLAQKNHKKLPEAASLVIKGYQLLHEGKYPASLKCLLQALTITEDQNNTEETWPVVTIEPSPGKSRLLLLSITHHMFGILMEQTQNTQQQIFHFKEALRIAREIGNANRQLLSAMNLGGSYLTINKLDSALSFSMEADRISDESSLNKYKGFILATIGDVYLKKGDKELAKKYYYAGLKSAQEQRNFSSIARNNIRLINRFLDEGKKDSMLVYALRNLDVVRSLGTVVGQGENPNNIASAYENVYVAYKLNNQFDSAFKYQGLALIANDSLSKERIRNLAEFQNMSLGEQLRLQNLEREKVINENRVRTWFLLGGMAILLLLAIFFYINNRQKHKAKVKIEKAYNDLKLTQQQLIQSEKMASLGELTAGIAHEIQNPLNFVNNFSEVNKELIEELMEERHKAQRKETQDIEDKVLDDIKANEEKINHHGKRADAIVKGMLQHSRSSTGQKESSEINALVDEYLRLAYHGLRAKDKSFNAGIKTDFDSSIGQIKIVPQDIGRAILNLINNAFYAVNEKAKVQSAAGGYKPLVVVNTKRKENKIEIKIADNGNGIPQNVVGKIFQPFFTTKPTGQGTGLGLSLAYDIVKAHGGEIKVNTTEGEGSEFIVVLWNEQ